METGDLEQQPEPLNTVNTSTDAGLANAEPATCASTAGEPARIASESTKVASEPVMTEPVVISPAPAKESLWQRLRRQPRETAAVVVLVVTAIIWLDSGDSNSQQGKTSKSLDPMDGFESYLSDFETEESSTPLRESADPVENQSPASFGGDLTIPQTQQSEFASTVTANYGDSVFEPTNSSSNDFATSTIAAQFPAAQYPADADAFGTPVHRANAGSAASDMNNSGSQQNRRVRFAGRIKPAN